MDGRNGPVVVVYVEFHEAYPVSDCIDHTARNAGLRNQIEIELGRVRSQISGQVHVYPGEGAVSSKTAHPDLRHTWRQVGEGVRTTSIRSDARVNFQKIVLVLHPDTWHGGPASTHSAGDRDPP